MDGLPWDLVFYGSSALMFIGIIASSRAARRRQRAGNKAAAGNSSTLGPETGDGSGGAGS